MENETRTNNVQKTKTNNTGEMDRSTHDSDEDQAEMVELQHAPHAQDQERPQTATQARQRHVYYG